MLVATVHGISGLEGGKLLVPFAGSGTEMIAGMRYGMHATGFEINEDYFNHAVLRLENEINQQKSPVKIC